MSKPINKINILNNQASFFQANTIRGFKYVDKAGEIVNHYHGLSDAPPFNMDLNGLIIGEPVGNINTLKITPKMFWVKFTKIDSLDLVIDVFIKEMNTIFEILSVEKINRIGWRNNFVYEFSELKEQNEYLKKFTVFEKAYPTIMRFDINTEEDFNGVLIIQPVVKNDDTKNPGIMFDIDLFKAGIINIEEVKPILKSFRRYLADEEGFVKILNNTF